MKSTLPIAIALLSATGCATEENLRLTLGQIEGDHVVLASVLPPVPDAREGLIGSTDHDHIPGDAPSMTGLDRSNFERVEFLVPIDQTYHHPDYSHPLTLTDNLARQRGEFPTPETVLDQNGSNATDDLAEMLLEPLWATAEFVWIFPSLIFDGPWEVTSSPQEIEGRTSDAPIMLVPGIVTLSEAEIIELESAPPPADPESQDDPIDPSEEVMPEEG